MSAVIENKSAAKFTYKHIGGEGLKATGRIRLICENNADLIKLVQLIESKKPFAIIFDKVGQKSLSDGTTQIDVRFALDELLKGKTADDLLQFIKSL